MLEGKRPPVLLSSPPSLIVDIDLENINRRSMVKEVPQPATPHYNSAVLEDMFMMEQLTAFHHVRDSPTLSSLRALILYSSGRFSSWLLRLFLPVLL